MVHEAEVCSVTEYFSKAAQITKLVICRLIKTWLVKGRVCEHNYPWLGSFLGIDNPVVVSLVVQVAHANRSPFLVHPQVDTLPSDIKVLTQANFVSILTIFFDIIL